MNDEGIIVGCDEKGEWLLYWWWENYSKTNSYPVFFADFGLSEKARNWCLEKGVLETCTNPFFQNNEKNIPIERKKLWEETHGTSIWQFRHAWFKKPFACQKSPFKKSIWIDLDCRVEKNLSELFNLLESEIDIAICKDLLTPFNFLDPSRTTYNSGVIAFTQKSSIISKWVELASHHFDDFLGDQDALSEAIIQIDAPIYELDSIYNWSWHFPSNEETVITHFHGNGKAKLINERTQAL
jgi:hypothetical protein